MPVKRKIVLLGFHKTATTSLSRALEFLGYSVANVEESLVAHFASGDYELIRPHTENFDVFGDDPWFLFYQQFDQWYPDAKFILTTRDPEKWFASFKDHFGDEPSITRDFVYEGNKPSEAPEFFKKTFTDHATEVRSYFDGRESDFLDFSLSDGHGWEELCTFLDQPIPRSRKDNLPIPFPTVNSREARSRPLLQTANRKALRLLTRLIGRQRAMALRATIQRRLAEFRPGNQ